MEHPPQFVEPAEPNQKRKRAKRACLRCRARKTRCDVTDNESTCTNCRLDSLECVVKARRQNRPTWNDGLKRYPRQRHINAIPRISSPGISVQNACESGGFDNSDIDSPHACEQIETESNRGHEWDSSDFSERLPILPPFPTDRVRVGVTATLCNSSQPLDLNKKSESNISSSHASSTLASEAGTVGSPMIPGFVKALPDSFSRDDLEFLRKKGALTVPNNPLRAQLLQGFVEYVYGYMPLLDLKELLQAIEREGKECAPLVSILLFQAIMFSGAAFIDMTHLRAAGYRSRREARKELFGRVKLLYTFEVERTNFVLIQSLLLMTHWYHDYDSHKDLWGWMGTITTLSQDCALHMELQPHGLSPRELNLRKRLGWCVFMRDQILALGMRRPPRIKMDSHTIPLLSLNDFECESLETTILPHNCIIMRNLLQQRQLAVLCIEKCKLCVCINSVLSTKYRPVSMMLPRDEGLILMLVPHQNMLAPNEADVCYQQLERWSRNLPIMCRYDSVSALNACESSVTVVHKALLKMIYLTVFAALYNPQTMPVSPWSTATSSLVKAASTWPAASRTTICSAAAEVSAIGFDLRNLGLVNYLPTSSVTALLPALITHLTYIAYAREEIMAQSMQHFSNGIDVLSLLSETYASAELAIRYLQGTIDVSNIPISRVTFLLQQSPSLKRKGRRQWDDIQIVDSTVGSDKIQVQSAHRPSPEMERTYQIPTSTSKETPVPEWCLWLDGEPWRSNIGDADFGDFWGPSYRNNMSDTADFSLAGTSVVCSNINSEILDWEPRTEEVRSLASNVNVQLEISSFLEGNAFLPLNRTDLEGGRVPF